MSNGIKESEWLPQGAMVNTDQSVQLKQRILDAEEIIEKMILYPARLRRGLLALMDEMRGEIERLEKENGILRTIETEPSE